MSDKNLKETLNLPQTDFPIRAGLINKEPALLEKWEQDNLYDVIKDKQEDAKDSYLLHDGPPYPNGPIHMGHALNKVLKDIIIRSKVMQGKKSTYVPGWDCHGLPIETQVIKELKKKKEEHKKTDIAWFRNRCKEFALDYVKAQKEEFQRLGIMGEWDQPYLTLNPSYEAKVIELFGQMADNGLVYKGRKPIHWCTHCETALAEAEIEYADHRSPSIYVTFQVTQASEALATILNGQSASVLVWTTTPWTLPANVAIAAHPDFEYVVFQSGSDIFICVQELKSALIETLELGDTTDLGVVSGKALMGTVTQHPFIERTSKIVNAGYVTKEDGTGFVHIAPGHGQDDYLVGQEYDLPMIMPVDNQGKFTKEVGQFAGTDVFTANKDIGMLMDEKGTLLKLKFIKHSYPHCWRCKSPVIFRATEQWFIAMDVDMKNDQKSLREKSLCAIQNTKWYPSWGENRIYSMVENRPDWCISRQRYWGIPIPVFTCQKCSHSEMTGEFNQAVVDLVRKDGTLAWFEKSAKEILPSSAKCSKCGCHEFEKESDILDVWFESGSSFAAVLENYDLLENPPANLYLEGSDQHRGWFHSSMLIGMGARNEAPYKEVLTHGFLVDDKGKKMSKSMGNVIAPQSVIKEYGADILRWWIASSDFKNDISISKGILNQARDSFSKVRNTIRFCLSNLYDFDRSKDFVIFKNRNEIDRWASIKLNQLVQKVNGAYNEFEFHQISHLIHNFCAVTMSALYLDMTKDRLYCDSKASLNRRSTQSTLFEIVDTLIRLVAPVMVFTAEDAYSHFDKPNKFTSVHLEELPTYNQDRENEALEEKWEKLLTIKDTVYQQLEKLRNEKIVKSFLEATVDVTLTEDIDFNDWEALFIVSQVNLSKGVELSAKASKADGEKCERCWKVLPVEDGLCVRCSECV